MSSGHHSNSGVLSPTPSFGTTRHGTPIMRSPTLATNEGVSDFMKEKLLPKLDSFGVRDPEPSFLRAVEAYMERSLSSGGYPAKVDCVLSYSIDQVGIAIRIHQSLTSRGFNVLLDLEKMNGASYAKIAERVFNAKAIIPMIMRAYEESPHCKRELVLASTLEDKCRKAIVPIHLDDGPFTWTGRIVGLQSDVVRINRRHIGDTTAWDDVMDLLALELSSALKSLQDAPVQAAEISEVDSVVAQLNPPIEYWDAQSPTEVNDFKSRMSMATTDHSSSSDEEDNPFGAPPGVTTPEVRSPVHPNFQHLAYGHNASSRSSPLGHYPPAAFQKQQPVGPRQLSKALLELHQHPLVNRHGLDYQVPDPLQMLHSGEGYSEDFNHRVKTLEAQVYELDSQRHRVRALESKLLRQEEQIRALLQEQERLRHVITEQERTATKQTQLMVKIVEFLGMKVPTD